MTVYELTRDQLDELRNDYFWSENGNGYFYPHEIPDDIIFVHYAGFNFVPDDFSCSRTL